MSVCLSACQSVCQSVLRLRGCFLIFLVFVGSACSDLDYYSHVVQGHLDILNKKQKITELLESDQTPNELKSKFKLIQTIRTFANSHLKLPQSGSYVSYVDLKRPYVTAVITASKKLDFEPKTWWYPFVGDLSYRGYFDKAKADDLAEQLQREGWDVKVGRVSAYSTLGWLNNPWLPDYFKDPLLNTFLNRSEASLIGTLIHEMAHQKIFIAGETAFNESFATFVEQEGLRQFLQQQGDDSQSRYQNYLDRQQDRQLFVNLVLGFVEKLKTLYKSDASDEEKLAQKAKIFQELKDTYRQRKDEFHVLNYDGFFAQNLNNAHLINIRRYHGNVEQMQEWYDQAGRNWEAFYEKVRQNAP